MKQTQRFALRPIASAIAALALAAAGTAFATPNPATTLTLPATVNDISLPAAVSQVAGANYVISSMQTQGQAPAMVNANATNDIFTGSTQSAMSDLATATAGATTVMASIGVNANKAMVGA